MSASDLPEAIGLTRLDRNTIELSPHAIVCCACVRDEALRLPHFLDYYRSLGIDRFVFIDNASRDGTTDLLLAQSDAHVFSASGSYAASNCGVNWINCALAQIAPDNWVLTVDADELLVYPRCETVPLGGLTAYLDGCGASGLGAFLLDMYAERPIRDTIYAAGTPFLDSCPYFDFDSYHQVGVDHIPVRGGPRHRLFWEGRQRPKPSPVLKKFPLVRWTRQARYEASTHRISGLRLPKLTGALLHFKFFSDFVENSAREVARKEHWDDAAQYGCYHDVLQDMPDLTAYGEHSKRYRNSLQLVDLGLMQMPAGFPSGSTPL
jgi:hypothetical protein